MEFLAYLVDRETAGKVRGQVQTVDLASLPAGEVLIRAQWSSLNYKDALAAGGHPGVVRKLPHVPGIDAAGVIEESNAANLRPGQRVVITGYDLGAGHWGGWSEYVRVPADWIVPLPDGLSLFETM